jgi:hypothetical protein
LKGASLKAEVICEPNYEDCPGHFRIILKRAYIDFESLKVELTGGTSWLYQSLINIILESI